MSVRKPKFVINNSNFEKKNFSNQDRNFSLINKSKFFNCSFEYTLFKETKLNDVIFKDCDLTGVVLRGSEFHNVEFNNCKMGKSEFQAAPKSTNITPLS